MANLYGRLLNITPRVKHIPGSAVKIIAKVIKIFHPGIGRIMNLSAFGETSDATMNTVYSIQQFGLRPTTIEEFVKKKLGIHIPRPQ